MLSCDVVSLYTTIPLNEALESFKDYISNTIDITTLGFDKDTIITLAELCLKDNYFCYGQKYYEQLVGLPMGGSLSSLIANIYMHTIDSKIVNLPNGLAPIVYYRYVDDIFCVISKPNLDKFKETINNLDNNIKFTFEDEIEGKLPFLDVEVTRNESYFSTDIYRKEIASNIILHYHSYHAKTQKIGLIYFFVHRAVKICSSPMSLAREIDFLKRNFLDHSYPIKIINKHFSKAISKFKTPKPVNSEKKEYKAFFSFPYTGNDNSNFKRVCNNAQIMVGQTPGNKIINMRANYKEKILPMNQSNIVYRINCMQCDKSYIGETGRSLKTRLSEHVRATKYKDSNYATFSHSLETGHSMDFENVEVVDKGKSYNHRLHLEAAYIATNKQGLNNNIGKREPKSIWKILFNVKTSHSKDPTISHNPTHTGSEEVIKDKSPIPGIHNVINPPLVDVDTQFPAIPGNNDVTPTHGYYLRRRK